MSLPESKIPCFTACIICTAFCLLLIIAAPAPCFSILLSGQPIFISMPSKPRSAHNLAAPRIFSIFDEKICATIGLSFWLYSKSFFKTSLPALIKPSAETNSVHNTSGLPYLAIICLKAGSVTSAMGASAKKGALLLPCFFCASSLNFCQKFILIKIINYLITVPNINLF